MKRIGIIAGVLVLVPFLVVREQQAAPQQAGQQQRTVQQQQQQQQQQGRQGRGRGRGGRGATLDSADLPRAAQLFVSNDPADHPRANYEAHMREKARTDSIFAARSQGVMEFRKITYRSSVDSLEIPAYLFAPLQKRGPAGHAAMVWVHGGVHGNMTAHPYFPFIKEAIERGYVIITPEYRGSTGYGEEFHNRIDYGGYEIDDCIDAVNFLKTLSYVDTTRLGMMGWSHGGFITAHTLFRDQHPFKAGAAMVPVTNLFFRLARSGPGYARNFSTQERIRGLPHERRDEYLARSPVFHAQKLKVPILVHVATNDTDVTFEENQQMVYTLMALKPDLAETKIYENPAPGHASGGHTFNRRANEETLERDDSPAQADSWNLTWAFFERNLRPQQRGPGGR